MRRDLPPKKCRCRGSQAVRAQTMAAWVCSGCGEFLFSDDDYIAAGGPLREVSHYERTRTARKAREAR